MCIWQIENFPRMSTSDQYSKQDQLYKTINHQQRLLEDQKIEKDGKNAVLQGHYHNDYCHVDDHSSSPRRQGIALSGILQQPIFSRLITAVVKLVCEV